MKRYAVLFWVCAISWTGLHVDLVVAQARPAESEAKMDTPDATQAEKNTGQKVQADGLRTNSQRSAHATLNTFIAAMEAEDFRAAIPTLDFSKLTPPPDVFQQIAYAQQLKFCIDRIALVDLDLVSDAPDGPEIPFPPDKADAVIWITRNDDQLWRFSAATVARLPALFDVLKDKPPVGIATVAEPKEATVSEPDTDEREGKKKVAQEAGDQTVQEIPEYLQSARRVMQTLFEALEEKDYARVVSALDFSELEKSDSELGPYAALEKARRLKAVIERMAHVDYREISDDPSGPPFYFPEGTDKPPIMISRGASGAWQFSSDTVADIDSLYEIYGNRSVQFLTGESLQWYRQELFMGQQIWQVATLFGAIFFSILFGQCVRVLAQRRAATMRDRKRVWTTLTLETIGKTVPAIALLLGVAFGLNSLTLAFKVEIFAGTMLHIIVTVIVGYICFRLVDVVVGYLREVAKRSGSTLNDMLVPIVSTSLRLTVIVLVLLEIATTVSDQPPSAVLAGLGAGGLAIGLAAQDTIKNFFGSVMIFADRPFELGDRIVIDGHDGPVETVGFRSTRVRTLDGHLVTIPNGEMAYKTIQNIGKRPYIRRVMNIHIAFGTAPEKVQQALEILRELLDQHEGYEASLPPRVFLEDFLDSAVNLRAIYWFHPPDYWDYCAFGERLNLQVMERFRDAGIEFALPAQKLFVLGESSADSTGVDA